MAGARFFVWADLETTGLDDETDPILEIGLVITHVGPPCEEITHYEAVVHPGFEGWEQHMTDQVKMMHQTNGLLLDVNNRGRDLREVENEILALLMSIGRPHNFMLAGSAVSHFDRRFIKRQMPGFDKWLQHPMMDVGVVRRGLKFCGRGDLDAYGQTFGEGDKPHRGLADVRDHLNEWRQYASIIESLPRED